MDADGSADDEPPSPEARWHALAELDDWLEVPMQLLSLVWLILVLVELTSGTSGAMEVFGGAIWIAFLIELAVRLIIAPDRRSFLVTNWLTVLALAVPAFRLFRALNVVRAARAVRALRLLRIVGTANRGMNALRISLRRRGLGYVLGTTIIIMLLGAAGMLTFEPASEVPGGFVSYWDALWWTGMLLTTIGSQFWPQTFEGRVLCFLMSLYGLGVFGYITASLASFFVGRDPPPPGAASADQLAELHDQIAALRRELRGRSSEGGSSR
jgi:voltage-gated potassium channel